MNPLDLLRRGYDYVEIASLLKTTEADVEKQIHHLREEEHRKAVKRESSAASTSRTGTVAIAKNWHV